MATGSIVLLDYPDTQVGAYRYKGEDITRPWVAGELVILIDRTSEPQTLSGQRWFTDEKEGFDEIAVLESKVETIVNLQLRRGPYGNQEIFDEKEVRLKDVRAGIPERVIINGTVIVWRVKISLTIKRVS